MKEYPHEGETFTLTQDGSVRIKVSHRELPNYSIAIEVTGEAFRVYVSGTALDRSNRTFYPYPEMAVPAACDMLLERLKTHQENELSRQQADVNIRLMKAFLDKLDDAK